MCDIGTALSSPLPRMSGLRRPRASLPRRPRSQRLRVELCVEWGHGTGITRDVSVGGVFFVTQQVFSPADPIVCTLIFEYLDQDRPIRLRCRGVAP
jgi:hypothetical protein